MNCELKFLRNSNGVFYSGSCLEATVELSLTEPMIVNSIVCRFIGYAKCSWALDISKYNLQKFSSRVDYLNDTLTIVEPLSPEGIELNAELHNFDFTFPLPSSLPTTFKSKYGTIKYKIIATVRFSSTSELEFELPFVVVCPLNLNKVTPSIAAPIKIELEKNFNFQIAPIDLNICAVIPKGGYVPGQSIEVLVQIENLGRAKVKYIKIALKKICVYTCHKPKHQEKKIVDNEVKEVIYREIPPKSTRDFIRMISVPPLPPNIENCEIIKVSYRLQVKAKTIGWNKSPKLKFPIFIGTIPIVSEVSEIESAAMGSEFDTMSVCQFYHEDDPSQLSFEIRGPSPAKLWLRFNTHLMDPPPYEESLAGRIQTDTSSDDE